MPVHVLGLGNSGRRRAQEETKRTKQAGRLGYVDTEAEVAYPQAEFAAFQFALSSPLAAKACGRSVP